VLVVLPWAVPPLVVVAVPMGFPVSRLLDQVFDIVHILVGIRPVAPRGPGSRRTLLVWSAAVLQSCGGACVGLGSGGAAGRDGACVGVGLSGAGAVHHGVEEGDVCVVFDETF